MDTADIDAIARANETGLLDGITTNPAKILETGKPFMEVLEEICSVVKGPVSAEAVDEQAGVDILTITETVFFDLFKHPLTDQGLLILMRIGKR